MPWGVRHWQTEGAKSGGHTPGRSVALPPLIVTQWVPKQGLRGKGWRGREGERIREKGGEKEGREGREEENEVHDPTHLTKS